MARSRRRLILFALAAVLLSGALASLAIEGLLRIYDPLPHPLADLRGLYEVDAAGELQLAAGWRGAQFVEGQSVPIAINRLGLRGAEVATKLAGEKRLLLVGDSFVFGQGVTAADAIPSQLERLLGQPARQVQVGNAGIAGTGPREWAHGVARFRASFAPDAVIAVLFVGNDVLDTLQDPVTVVDGWLLTSSFAATARESWRFRLRVTSRLWDKVETVLGSANLFTMGKATSIGPGIALGEALFLDRDPARDAEMPFYGEVQTRLRAAFAKFNQAADGLPKLVVLLPSRSVMVGDYGSLLAQHGLDPAAHRCGIGHQRLRAWLQAEGLAVLDLLEPLQRRADRAALYLPTDGHFNPAGCAAVAAELRVAAGELLGF